MQLLKPRSIWYRMVWELDGQAMGLQSGMQGRPFYCLLSLWPLARLSVLVSWVTVVDCTQPGASSLTLSAAFLFLIENPGGLRCQVLLWYESMGRKPPLSRLSNGILFNRKRKKLSL